MEHLLDVEKRKATSGEFAEMYKNLPIRQLPHSALIYNLTQLFHCTPSQLLQEDYATVMEILSIHNTYGEIDNAVQDADERNRKSKIKNPVNTRYLTIAVELEKLKAK